MRSLEAGLSPTYPGVAERLLACCREYRRRVEGLDVLKTDIWWAASQISVSEERVLREFLQQAEGRLDMIQFRADESEVGPSSLEVVATIEARLVSYLAG
jgi:hypothetical protein